MTDLEKFVREDLARSGLTLDGAKKMGARFVTAKTASELIGVNDVRPGIWFPTLDVDGAPIPNHGAVRYMNGAPSTFLDAAIEFPKYRLPKDSAVRVSFTPQADAAKTWREVIADPSETIVIVEGQKKAMRLAREGYNVIALHGVTMFSASKTGRKLIDDLARVKWGERDVLIIFDSDIDGNPDVIAAERRLAGILRQFGARVATPRLTPTDDGKKRGVDDFLQQQGVEALQTIITSAWSNKYSDLIKNHALVLSPHAIIEMAAATTASDTVVPFHVFKQSIAPQFNERVPGANGTAVVINNFNLWLEDNRRTRYEKCDFVPGGVFPDVDVPSVGLCRNSWRGWPVKLERGDCKPWLDLHARLYAGKPAWMLQYSLDWYSHLVQFPGDKCTVAQVIIGRSGIGKDWLPELLGQALGRHFKQIDAGDLKSSFTEYLEDTLLVDAMEASAPDRRSDADFFKSLIARKTNTVNIKYGGKYQQTNHMRLVLTSNHPDPVFATDDERRFFVNNSLAQPMDKQEIAQMRGWRDDQNGPAHILTYFANAKISPAFDATAPAPKTDDFYEVVAANQSEIETYVEDIIADPYGRLEANARAFNAKVAPERDIYTSDELLRLMGGTHVYSPTALSKAMLKSRKFARPGSGLKNQQKRDYRVQLKDRKSPRLWAVANVEYWKTASDREWAYEYERGINYSTERGEKLYPPKARKKAA